MIGRSTRRTTGRQTIRDLSQIAMICDDLCPGTTTFWKNMTFMQESVRRRRLALVPDFHDLSASHCFGLIFYLLFPAFNTIMWMFFKRPTANGALVKYLHQQTSLDTNDTTYNTLRCGGPPAPLKRTSLSIYLWTTTSILFVLLGLEGRKPSRFLTSAPRLL